MALLQLNARVAVQRRSFDSGSNQLGVPAGVLLFLGHDTDLEELCRTNPVR